MNPHNKQKIIGRRIKIGILGCGRISINHIKALALHYKSIDLVALCDNKKERINNALKTLEESFDNDEKIVFKPQVFYEYNDLLNEVKAGKIAIDLIVIATPSGLHSQQTISAAKIGLHVCTEKPMATKWKDGLAMQNACDEAGVKLFVVKQNRFNSTLQLVKKQINKGRFGKIAMVGINVFWQRPQSYYDKDYWRGTWEFDGGALMNQASHYVDLLHWLFGPVEYLNAIMGTISRKIEVEDTAALNIKWRDGAIGSMAVTMLTYPENLEGSITILGDKGSVKIAGKAVNKIEYWNFSDNDNDDSLVEKASYETSSVYGFGHPAFYNSIINDLRGEEPSICSGRSGLNSLELLIASYISARDSKTIYLPLEL